MTDGERCLSPNGASEDLGLSAAVVLDVIQDGICILDTDLNIIRLNRSRNKTVNRTLEHDKSW